MRLMAIDPGAKPSGRTSLIIAAIGMLLAAPTVAQLSLSSAERAAAFKAAGFKLEGGKWRGCGDPGTATYRAGALEAVRDLNGDGRPEVLIVEGSTYCFGSTENGYVLVSKQADGSWRRITAVPAFPAFFAPKGQGVAGYRGGWARFLLSDRGVERPRICAPPPSI